MSTALFLPGAGCESIDDPSSVAYRGLVKCHAAELFASARFQRTGRLTPNEVHAVARDLDQLDRPHSLDGTIELILARTDELELEREAG